jgi:hypothetical protein
MPLRSGFLKGPNGIMAHALPLERPINTQGVHHMSRFNSTGALLLSLTLFSAPLFAETVTSEKTVTTKSDSDGVVTEQTETSTHNADTGYVSRTITAYKDAGIPQDVVVKLRDYDTRIVQARRAGDLVKIREYYDAESRLLTPVQVTKVRTYLRAHPVSEEPLISVWEKEPVVTKEVREVHTESPTVVHEVETHPAAEVRIGPIKAGVGTTTEKTKEIHQETTVRTEEP